MFNIFSNQDGELISLSINDPHPEGWTHEVQTVDSEYIHNHYKSIATWCEQSILQLERQQDRPLREIAVAQSTGASSEFARNKVIQLDQEISSLRTQMAAANAKLGALNGN
jgi:hypothetical protein